MNIFKMFNKNVKYTAFLQLHTEFKIPSIPTKKVLSTKLISTLLR